MTDKPLTIGEAIANVRASFFDLAASMARAAGRTERYAAFRGRATVARAHADRLHLEAEGRR